MSSLPIRRVVLYKHGVGYFEREAAIEGDQSLVLSFKQREVSDVLKSLTVLDLNGGTVSTVSYDSTTPIEQLLAEIALNIPDSELDKERKQIHEEQKRIRENLKALGDRASEKELRERFIRTLGQHEDRLETIGKEEKKLQTERDGARSKLNSLIAGLEVEAEVPG